jgi:two-component system response regulator RegX3
MRLAILEDQPEHAALLQEWLAAAGHHCQLYASGRLFLKDVARESFDMMLIDWEVPDLSGEAVLRWVRVNIAERVPVLFITGRDAEEDIVHALAAGADDYMVKPPRRLELIARIAALSRRVPAQHEPAPLDFPPYRIDTARREISMRGTPVELTAKEYELAVFLFRNIGRLVSRGHIEQAVWGRTAEVQSRSLDTHLSHLRRKLALNPGSGYRLVPVYSHGYRFERIAGSGEDAPPPAAGPASPQPPKR